MNYADNMDRATALEELEREHSLTRIRQQAQVRDLPTGSCKFCENDVEHPKIFCDEDCRDMWQHLQAANKRNGVKS